MNLRCLLGHKVQRDCFCTVTCASKGCDWSERMDELILDCDAHGNARQKLMDALGSKT